MTKTCSDKINPPLNVGDRFQVGLELTSGKIMWGTIQTVTALTSEGCPYYLPKWAKKDKLPDFWRIPPAAALNSVEGKGSDG